MRNILVLIIRRPGNKLNKFIDQASIYLLAGMIFIVSGTARNANAMVQPVTKDSVNFKSGHLEVNGIKMYYEMYGEGNPLVLLHGGGSTIQSTWGRIIPMLSKDHKVIAMDLQNHGRSGHRKEPETFPQDARDVVELLRQLNISKADFFGFSNGGETCIQIAIDHPGIINKLILCSAPYKISGFQPGFFEMMNQVSFDQMPDKLKEEFLKVNNDSALLMHMFESDANRMKNFKGWTDEQVQSIQAPTLLINGDKDVLTPEHAVEMHRMIKNSSLAVLPGVHGECIGEVTTLRNDGKDSIYIIPMIESFLARRSGD
jgi:pimeloyl-ACP methyl ester carboxylesterase